MKRCVMSREPKTSEDPASLRRGNFTYFPVIPGRLEFSIELRQAILRERPRIVAVELPGSLEDVYLQALARLPEMSVIVYPDPTDDERGIYVPVEPCDPFTEAVRTALEIDDEDIAAHAGGMAWKLQGSDPLAHVFVVVSLNLLDPVLDAMEVPQDPPRRRDLP